MVGAVQADPAAPLRRRQEPAVLVHPHVADGGPGRPGELVDGEEFGHQSGKVMFSAAVRAATASGKTLRTRYRSRNIGQSGANSFE